MRLLACLLIATIIAAWDPVRPGVLVKKIGDLIIIKQSVRITLEFSNVTYVRDNLKVINHGLKIAQEKLQEKDRDNVRIARKLSVIRKKIDTLESNFLHTRNERAIGVLIAISALAGLDLAGFSKSRVARRPKEQGKHFATIYVKARCVRR